MKVRNPATERQNAGNNLVRTHHTALCPTIKNLVQIKLDS